MAYYFNFIHLWGKNVKMSIFISVNIQSIKLKEYSEIAKKRNTQIYASSVVNRYR